MGLRNFEEMTDEPTSYEEAISAAALEYNGQIFTGRSHAEAFLKLDEAEPDFIDANLRDGFVTTNGRFVTREEALQIAKKTEQVSTHKLKRGENMLDSNDVNWFQR